MRPPDGQGFMSHPAHDGPGAQRFDSAGDNRSKLKLQVVLDLALIIVFPALELAIIIFNLVVFGYHAYFDCTYTSRAEIICFYPD